MDYWVLQGALLEPAYLSKIYEDCWGSFENCTKLSLAGENRGNNHKEIGYPCFCFLSLFGFLLGVAGGWSCSVYRRGVESFSEISLLMQQYVVCSVGYLCPLPAMPVAPYRNVVLLLGRRLCALTLDLLFFACQ